MSNKLPDNERAIWILKNAGPQTLLALAAEMGITTEGARFQMLKLANEGFVEAKTESKGRGRPQQVWSLTALGNAKFPDRHSELTVRLLKKIRETLGEEALNAVIDANGKDNLARYQYELRDANSLEEKVNGLAAIREREGYMAAWQKTEDGFLLTENHCPICAAASECGNVCQSELSAFQTIFGEAAVLERVEHIQEGARRCAYRITKVRENVSEI